MVHSRTAQVSISDESDLQGISNEIEQECIEKIEDFKNKINELNSEHSLELCLLLCTDENGNCDALSRSYYQAVKKIALRHDITISLYQPKGFKTPKGVSRVITEIIPQNKSTLLFNPIFLEDRPKNNEYFQQVYDSVDPKCDPDGLHSENKDNRENKDKGIKPATPKSCISHAKLACERIGIEWENANIVVIGANGMTVGQPLVAILKGQVNNVSCIDRQSNIEEKNTFFQKADVIINVTGTEKAFDGYDYKTHGKKIIIDVGLKKSSTGEMIPTVPEERLQKDHPMKPSVIGGLDSIGKITCYELINNFLILEHRKLLQKAA